MDGVLKVLGIIVLLPVAALSLGLFIFALAVLASKLAPPDHRKLSRRRRRGDRS